MTGPGSRELNEHDTLDTLSMAQAANSLHFGGKKSGMLDACWFQSIWTGWWFGTFSNFPYIRNNHPNWRVFFRGVETTNQWIISILGDPQVESFVSTKRWIVGQAPATIRLKRFDKKGDLPWATAKVARKGPFRWFKICQMDREFLQWLLFKGSATHSDT